MILDLILEGILQGLVLALVAFGIMISFKLLNFPDLTAEGAYPLGGVVSASMLLLNINPYLAVLLSGIIAGIAGIATAFIALRFRINSLLSAIIVTTMLYSINLKLMGKPNIALFEQITLFFNESIIIKITTILCIIVIVSLPFFIFLYTKTGLCLRVVGINKNFAAKQGISITFYTFMGLFLSNMCTGCAGSLMVQVQHYADIGMGVGIVIHALAALMIGESLLGTNTLIRQILAPLVGALIYQQIQGFVLFLGLAPSDLKLFTGIVLLAVLYIHPIRRIA